MTWFRFKKKKKSIILLHIAYYEFYGCLKGLLNNYQFSLEINKREDRYREWEEYDHARQQLIIKYQHRDWLDDSKRRFENAISILVDMNAKWKKILSENRFQDHIFEFIQDVEHLQALNILKADKIESWKKVAISFL